MRNQVRRFVTLLSLAAALAVSARASAHARLETPVPRSTDSGIILGPCGADAHTAATAYKVGSTVTVNFEETIHHSGSFHIFFAPTADQNLSTGTTPGMVELYSAPQSFTDNNVPHQYTAQITFPSTPCPSCTLQLVQYNTDRTPTIYYFSCADIALTTTTPPPPPPPAPIPTPAGPTCTTGGAAVTLTELRANIITPICAQCHKPGGLAPTDYTTYAGIMTQVNLTSPAMSPLYTATLDGAMPQGGPALSAPQVSQILQWIQAGAPNN